MNSASAAGIALAAPLTGLAVQIGGWRLGFLVAAGLTATLPALTVVVGGDRPAIASAGGPAPHRGRGVWRDPGLEVRADGLEVGASRGLCAGSAARG